MNQVAKKDESPVEGYTLQEVQDIRAMFDPNKKLSSSQLRLFFYLCKERNLDPRLKHIYAIPRYNSTTQRQELTTVVSIDGFRLVAERTGKYSPGKSTEYLRDSEGKLIGATVYIKKQTSDGSWHDISETAFLDEYMPSGNNMFWKKMPSVMISKVAEMRALRRAFPDAFSGLYGEEEMHQAGVKVENPEFKEVVQEVIDQDQATILDEMIGDNEIFRNQLMGYIKKAYNLETLVGIPVEIYTKAIKRLIEIKSNEYVEAKEG